MPALTTVVRFLGTEEIRGSIPPRELPQKAADVQARVLLTVFYFTMMLPFGIVLGLFKDPLRIKSRPSGSYRVERKPVSETLADAKRQF